MDMAKAEELELCTPDSRDALATARRERVAVTVERNNLKVKELEAAIKVCAASTNVAGNAQYR